MELDDLKKIWQENRGQFLPKQEAELISMMRGNSTSIVEKLKKSVWFELVFTAVAGIALLVYAVMLPSGALKFTSISFLFVFVGYSLYYIKKILLLNRFNPVEGNLRESLGKLILNLESHLTFYKQSYTILYPVFFLLGLLFVAVESGADRFLERLSEPKVILSLVLMGAALLFLSTWFASWYLKKLYGNYLDNLRSVLTDLQREDEAIKASA
jgi:hypothetical protein